MLTRWIAIVDEGGIDLISMTLVEIEFWFYFLFVKGFFKIVLDNIYQNNYRKYNN